MTSRDFAYWLQGFFEITGTDELTPEQVKMIKDHLNLVFYHAIENEVEKPEERKMMSCGSAGRTQGWMEDYSSYSSSSGEAMTCGFPGSQGIPGTSGVSGKSGVLDWCDENGATGPERNNDESSHVVHRPQFLQEHLEYHEIPNDLQHS